jgi:hypothetical protein
MVTPALMPTIAPDSVRIVSFAASVTLATE